MWPFYLSRIDICSKTNWYWANSIEVLIKSGIHLPFHTHTHTDTRSQTNTNMSWEHFLLFDIFWEKKTICHQTKYFLEVLSNPSAILLVILSPCKSARGAIEIYYQVTISHFPAKNLTLAVRRQNINSWSAPPQRRSSHLMWRISAGSGKVCFLFAPKLWNLWVAVKQYEWSRKSNHSTYHEIDFLPFFCRIIMYTVFFTFEVKSVWLLMNLKKAMKKSKRLSLNI